MTTAVEQLAKYNVSLEQARDWVLSKLSNPQEIFTVAREFGITNSMLGEIAGGYSATDVQGFFSAHGINSAVLDAPVNPGTGGGLLTGPMIGLASLVSLNTASGMLSNESLRAQVVSAIGGDTAKYQAAFSPTGIQGAADGQLSAADLAALGLSHLSQLPATWQTLESLYYGTLIKAFKSIDQLEIDEITQFIETNSDGLQAGNEAVVNQYMNLMVGVFQDPANPPLFDDTFLSVMAKSAGQGYVELVAQGGAHALFDGLLTGFF